MCKRYRICQFCKARVSNERNSLTAIGKALAFKPDLVSLIAGANDVLKGRWNLQTYKNDMEFMIDTLSKTGADIMIANLPDFTVRLPFSSEKTNIKRTIIRGK